MNPSRTVFRSHLMQQFAAAARTQARPPLALASVTAATAATSSSSSSSRCASASTTADARLTTSSSRTSSIVVSSRRRHHSSLASSHDNDNDATTLSAADIVHDVMLSRRTASKLVRPGDHHQWTTERLASALRAAVACAQHAPNHKRTEPFFFERLLLLEDTNNNTTTNSSSIDRLAEICYHVTLKRKHDKNKAEQKRDRWASIPAYLVSCVEGQPNQVVVQNNNSEEQDNNDNDEDDDYAELPFVPPETERQLEDYAAACAAVQNVLLSLEAQGLGSKWATGPVLKTRAFRKLCRLQDTDRVVGLIMVGEAAAESKKFQKPRRFRRSGQDLLRDL